MARRTLTIPAPVADIGARVLVANYRAAGEPCEPGTLERATYQLHYRAWSYEVWLDRASPRTGKRMWRYVGDDKIRRVSPAGSPGEA